MENLSTVTYNGKVTWSLLYNFWDTVCVLVHFCELYIDLSLCVEW